MNMTSNICIKLEENLPGVNLYNFQNECGKNVAISNDQIRVEFNPNKWRRATNDSIEIQIENEWQKKLKLSKVFNATKFRYCGIELRDSKVEIKLGLTSYKDVVGTSLAPYAKLLQSQGLEEDGNLQKYMSDGLGVGILAFTSDDHLILTRRAGWTGEYPNMLDRPGGHPEPDNVLLTDGTIKDGNDDDVHVAVANELWSSPVQELQDEIGVLKELVTDQRLLGLVINTEQGGRPSLEFLTRVQATAEEVRRQYSTGLHLEAEESTSLHLLSKEFTKQLLDRVKYHSKDNNSIKQDATVPSLDLNNVAKIFEDSTPALKGALALYAEATFQN